MRADRDKKVTIKSLSTTQDDYGQPLNEYVDVVTCWASVEPLIGREYYAAEQVQAEAKIKVRTEFIPGIKENMVVFYGDRKFEIVSVINPKEQNRELLLMCKELIDNE